MKKVISSLLIFSFLFSVLSFRVSAESYTLAPGDTLEVKIIGQSKFDTKQTIAPDGKVNLPILGRITIQGYTMDKLTEYLNEEFSLYLTKPQVIIYLIPRPIYIIQHDIKKNTWEVKEAKSVEEARALAGKDYKGEIKHGDIITVEVSKKADFIEANWYRIITATAVLAGVYATLNR
ncbi:polysaccharide biosynthesis/export family protein [Candidatus Margulisiibacteriota bacterium]